jgi:hypothetical protein
MYVFARMCFVRFSEQTAIISLSTINWVVFVMENVNVYCDVGTKVLCILYMNVMNVSFWLQLIRSYRLEYHHEPLQYKVTFMYAPDGELKFKLIRR